MCGASCCITIFFNFQDIPKIKKKKPRFLHVLPTKFDFINFYEFWKKGADWELPTGARKIWST